MSPPGSPRSVVSGTWDQVVDFIINSSDDTRSVHDDGRHEPTIFEDEEPVRPERTYSVPYYRPRSVFRPMNYVEAWTQHVHHHHHQHDSESSAKDRRESDLDSGPTLARASTIPDLNSYDLDIPLNVDVDIDTTLKLPDTKSIHTPQADDDDNDNDEQHDKQEPGEHDEKTGRPSCAGSHSGSSTVHEDAHDGHADLEAHAGSTHAEAAASKAPYSAFSTRAKRLIVLGAASASIFAPLSMQIYLPSLTTLVEDFGVGRTQINLTVSVYMVFMAISPMLVGGIADVAGRRPALLVCFGVYMVSCVLLALCQTYSQLMGFRILQSIGASPTIAIASAVVADIVTSAERGSYAALVAVPVIFAPTLGPVFGGLLTQYLGWRAIFWFLLVAGAVGFVLLLVAFPETCRVIVGDASMRPPARYRSVLQAVAAARGRDPRPAYHRAAAPRTTRRRALLWSSLTSAVRVLFTKDRFLLLVYVGVVFSGFNAIATELPTQFKALYGYDSVMIGVMYIPMAGGAMLSTAVFGKHMNRNFRKYAARQGINLEAGQQVDMAVFPVEKARLEVTVAPLLLATAGIMCWGWVLEMRTSVAAPCVLLFVMGVGLNGVMASTNALLMDISAAQAGAVMAASNLTRCALGAVASAVIQTMIDALGLGWTYVIFGVVFLMCSPMLIVQYYKGLQWRTQAQRREAALEEAAKGKDICMLETGSVMDMYSRRPDQAKIAEVEAAAAGAPIPLVDIKASNKHKEEGEETPRDSIGSRSSSKV